VQSSAGGAPSGARVRNLISRAARLTRREVARATRGEPAEVSVLFCGDARMRSLNARFRRKDKTTDVLAFPAPAGGLLGDIVVSVPYAKRQARRRGEPASRELDRLLLHGFLHLLGYDHETDDGQMDALEGRIRRRLKIADVPEIAEGARA
jgi:probable rRNA maturation factor